MRQPEPTKPTVRAVKRTNDEQRMKEVEQAAKRNRDAEKHPAR